MFVFLYSSERLAVLSQCETPQQFVQKTKNTLEEGREQTPPPFHQGCSMLSNRHTMTAQSASYFHKKVTKLEILLIILFECGASQPESDSALSG